MTMSKKRVSLLLVLFITAALNAKPAALATVRLKNNIPVYIQQNTNNRILALYIVVQGGTALLTPDQSGLENALFTMMTRGSRLFTYDQIQYLLYTTKAAVSPSSLENGSILGLSCIDYYFNKMFPVLADGFINPVFGQNEYANMMNEYAQNIQQMENDPGSLLQHTAKQLLYKGHPYETDVGPTKESLPNITIENMKSLLVTMLDAKRISVVAVGNFNEKELMRKLNATLGTLPVIDKNFTPAPVEQISVGGAPVVITHPAAQGTGLLAQVFLSPSINSSDYVAASITSNIYSELLYNIVREKYGACYTPGSSIASSKAPVGMVYIYRASDLAHVVGYVDEAKKLMEQGKLIAGKKADGTYAFTTVEERIEGYRNSYLNARYEGMQTNGGVAGRIAGSILQFNDPQKYISVMESARNVTAADVERVFKKYWCTDNVQWFAVVGPKDKEAMLEYLQ